MGLGIQWKRNSQAAAYLHCEELRSIRMRDEHVALTKWGKANASNILKTKPETRKRGFFIVTAIHYAKSSQLSCWQKTTRDISGDLSGNLSFVPVQPDVGGSNFAGAVHSGWLSRPSDGMVLTFLIIYDI